MKQDRDRDRFEDVEIEIVVAERPVRVVIDPYYKLIDRNTSDNYRDVEQAPSRQASRARRDMMLNIEDVDKTYGNGVHALRDSSLEVGPGMFGLLGPNGAGKSTLMGTLATLQQANSGSVSLDGTAVLRDPETVRGQLGYLPQEFGLYPRVSAEILLRHFAVLASPLPPAP